MTSLTKKCAHLPSLLLYSNLSSPLFKILALCIRANMFFVRPLYKAWRFLCRNRKVKKSWKTFSMTWYGRNGSVCNHIPSRKIHVSELRSVKKFWISFKVVSQHANMVPMKSRMTILWMMDSTTIQLVIWKTSLTKDVARVVKVRIGEGEFNG